MYKTGVNYHEWNGGNICFMIFIKEHLGSFWYLQEHSDRLSAVIKVKWGLRSAKLWVLLSIIATNFFIKLILKNEKFILLSRNILSKIILSTTPQYAFIKFESATYRHVYRFNAYNFLGCYHLHRRSMKEFTLISCLRDIPKEHKKHVI